MGTRRGTGLGTGTEDMGMRAGTGTGTGTGTETGDGDVSGSRTERRGVEEGGEGSQGNHQIAMGTGREGGSPRATKSYSREALFWSASISYVIRKIRSHGREQVCHM